MTIQKAVNMRAKLRAEGNRLRAEGNRFEGARLLIKGDIVVCDFVIAYIGPRATLDWDGDNCVIVNDQKIIEGASFRAARLDTSAVSGRAFCRRCPHGKGQA